LSRHSGIFLAFIAGFVDTVTFVRFGGLFSSHVTGNFVVFAAALGRGVGDADWLKLIAFPVFVLGVILAVIAHDRLNCAPRLLLACEAAILCAIGAAGLFGPLRFGTEAWLAMALVAAMGWQNAGHRLYPPFGPVSGAMTTNITQATVALWRHLVPAPAGVHEVTGLALLRVIASFAAGCAISIFVVHAIGLGAVLVPALLLAILAAAWGKD
jgi:uncharacterized membrane protein YoaK (UPF0700 family)